MNSDSKDPTRNVTEKLMHFVSFLRTLGPLKNNEILIKKFEELQKNPMTMKFYLAMLAGQMQQFQGNYYGGLIALLTEFGYKAEEFHPSHLERMTKYLQYFCELTEKCITTPA